MSKSEHLIELSIIKSLCYISNKENWKYILEILTKIPVPVIDIIGRNFLNNDNIEFIINAYT